MGQSSTFYRLIRNQTRFKNYLVKEPLERLYKLKIFKMINVLLSRSFALCRNIGMLRKSSYESSQHSKQMIVRTGTDVYIYGIVSITEVIYV